MPRGNLGVIFDAFSSVRHRSSAVNTPQIEYVSIEHATEVNGTGGASGSPRTAFTAIMNLKRNVSLKKQLLFPVRRHNRRLGVVASSANVVDVTRGTETGPGGSGQGATG